MSRDGGSRERLLQAAADLIAASPGEEFSLRAVCDAVGVGLPTLYHFFGSKQGLIDAVIDRGFDLYMADKKAAGTTGDPIQDIRVGWDVHVAFGLTHPGFYTLMYGKVRPGYSPEAQATPSIALRALLRQAEEQGRLVVGHQQAAAHVLVTNIGVTLRQIILAEEDRPLSIAVREGAIAAITGSSSSASAHERDDVLRDASELAAAYPSVLGVEETRLLLSWLRTLREHQRER